MKLALVAIHPQRSPEAIPLGAACIAAAIQAHPALSRHINSTIYEASLDEEGPVGDLYKRIVSEKPDLVGLSLYVWNRAAMAELAGMLRRALPDARFFAGGPEASAAPDSVQRDFGVDFVVLGEGESCIIPAMAALVAGGQTPNTYQAKPPITDELASPWLTGIVSPAHQGGVLWELARGCPFACSFCFESRGQPGVRPFPLARIEAELRLFAQAKIQHVFILDPTFNANRQRAMEVLRLLGKHGRSMHFTIEVRAEFLDQAQAQAFAGVDCSLQIGLQSSHPAVLARVNRKFNKVDFAAKIDLLNRFGIVFGLDLIYGLPGDSLAGFRQSLDWALALQPNHLDVFPLAVLPGTQLALDAPGWQIEYDQNAPYIVTAQPGFPAGDMAQAAALAQACDIFYNRGRAVPWFKLVAKGLGLSGIELLSGFADYQKSQPVLPKNPSHSQIETRQLNFLEAWCRQNDKAKLLPAIGDLVRLHGAYSRAMAEGESSKVRLHYAKADLESPAILNLAKFVEQTRLQNQTIQIKG